MGKNVAVFVDVANIFYAAKAAGVDIDYVTLLKAAIAGRDFVRAYAYTGLDPDNENQRNFHSFLSRHGYKVVSKDIRKYGDGKVKANLDIELVVDMMKTARNLDVAIVVSGDGDFAPAIRAIQEMGVRVEVISFRGNTSSDLIEVADQFSDITQLARVERSGRSGRRVADDEFDLSMTEVPDKQTEGTGAGRSEPWVEHARTRAWPRSGSRSRAGGSVAAAARIAALAGPERRERRRDHGAAGREAVGPRCADPKRRSASRTSTWRRSTTRTIEVLEEAPGAATASPRRTSPARGADAAGAAVVVVVVAAGRGDEVAPVEADQASAQQPARPEVRLPYEDEEVVPGPARPRQRPTPFGSIWDSQLGVPASPPPAAAEFTAFPDEDEEDEPEIPEYLLAERRREAGGRPGRSAGRPDGRSPRGLRGRARSRALRPRCRGASSRFQEPMGRPPMPTEPAADSASDRISRRVGDRTTGAIATGTRGWPGPCARPASRPSGWTDVGRSRTSRGARYRRRSRSCCERSSRPGSRARVHPRRVGARRRPSSGPSRQPARRGRDGDGARPRSGSGGPQPRDRDSAGCRDGTVCRGGRGSLPRRPASGGGSGSAARSTAAAQPAPAAEAKRRCAGDGSSRPAGDGRRPRRPTP